MTYRILNKIVISTLLIVGTLSLGGCGPILQGASTITSVIAVNNDRRSAGEILDDKTTSIRLFTWANEDLLLEDAHLNFMVYNKAVLITGEVPSKAIYSYIGKNAKSQSPQIEKVLNEVVVGSNSGLISRAKDSAITIQAEAIIQDQEVFHPTHIRIMTEAQTIYLMGSVTKREADKATKLVAKAKGTKRVVKLFNYLKTRPAAEIERDRLRKIEEEKKKDLVRQRDDLNAKKADIQRQLRALENSQ